MKNSIQRIAMLMVLLLGVFGTCTVYADGVQYKVISQPQWDEIRPFSEGMAAVKQTVVVNSANGDYKDEKWGFIDSDGKVIIQPQYISVGDYHEGLVWCLNINERTVIVDKSGKIVLDGNTLINDRYKQLGIENKYNNDYGSATNCSQGIIGFKYWSVDYIDYYDIKGKFIAGATGLEEEWYGWPFSDDLACVQFGYMGKAGFIDKSGKITYINSGKEGDIRPFNQGLALAAVYEDQKLSNGKVQKVTRWGVIDKAGKYVIKPQFESFYVNDLDICQALYDGFATVKKDGKWGVVDKSGSIIVKPSYFFLSCFNNGYAIYQANQSGKYGVIDKTGKAITKPIYDKTEKCYSLDGLFAVEKGGKWGYIDSKGKEIIKTQYDDYSSFSNGVALVKQNLKYYWIDKQGKNIGTLNEKIDGFNGISKDGYIFTKLNNKVGIIKL